MLYKKYCKENKDYLFEIGKVFTGYLLENFEAKDIVEQKERYNNVKVLFSDISGAFQSALAWGFDLSDEEQKGMRCV